jgi:hypothetical protein
VSRRKRYDDVRTVGRSEIVPFVPGEDPKHRHYRRLRANLGSEENVRAWCTKRGISLSVHNDGHHWVFSIPGGGVVEWWPSSAKCVANRDYKSGVHVHDWQQLRRLMTDAIKLSKGSND